MNMTREKAADIMMDVAERYVDSYSEVGEYSHIIKTDAHDLRKIAYAIEGGHLLAAKQMVLDLDTAVRDEIPECIWDFLNKQGAA